MGTALLAYVCLYREMWCQSLVAEITSATQLARRHTWCRPPQLYFVHTHLSLLVWLGQVQVRGRFARNDDAGAVQPHESRKALLAAKKNRVTKWSPPKCKAAGAHLCVSCPACPCLTKLDKLKGINFLSKVAINQRVCCPTAELNLLWTPGFDLLNTLQ